MIRYEEILDELMNGATTAYAYNRALESVCALMRALVRHVQTEERLPSAIEALVFLDQYRPRSDKFTDADSEFYVRTWKNWSETVLYLAAYLPGPLADPLIVREAKLSLYNAQRADRKIQSSETA